MTTDIKNSRHKMPTVVAINGSPRSGWNTDTLVTEAARGAASAGASIMKIDLYKLERFTGCISCFRCKQSEHRGRCLCRDGLSPVLEAIRYADALIIGVPNYLGDVSSGFRSLYERLIFQSITYKSDIPSYSGRSIPVLFIFTSNAPAESYDKHGYSQMLANYKNTLSKFVGPTQIMICYDTLQVTCYKKYNWDIFDPDAKRARHSSVFPQEKAMAFKMGSQLL